MRMCILWRVNLDRSVSKGMDHSNARQQMKILANILSHVGNSDHLDQKFVSQYQGKFVSAIILEPAWLEMACQALK